MSRFVAFLLALVGMPVALQLGAQRTCHGDECPDHPSRIGAELLQAPARRLHRREHGNRDQFQGHIFIFHRSGETRLYEYDEKGTFVKEIGRGNYGFSFAHSVRVDAQDNIWAVDEGTNMVIKFNPEGTKILMTIGRRPDPVAQLTNMPGGGGATNANKPYEFARPTDVAFDAQGNIFVADGYVDARVAKYDKNGRFVKSAGTQGSGQDQLNLPHTISADAAGNIYIGDRSNGRVQVLGQRPQVQGFLHQRRQSLGGMRIGRTASVSLRFELLAGQRSGRERRHDRRNLQDGARTARSWASSARRGRLSASSRRPTRWTAATRTSSTPPKSTTGDPRKSS